MQSYFQAYICWQRSYFRQRAVASLWVTWTLLSKHGSFHFWYCFVTRTENKVLWNDTRSRFFCQYQTPFLWPFSNQIQWNVLSFSSYLSSSLITACTSSVRFRCMMLYITFRFELICFNSWTYALISSFYVSVVIDLFSSSVRSSSLLCSSKIAAGFSLMSFMMTATSGLFINSFIIYIARRSQNMSNLILFIKFPVFRWRTPPISGIEPS